jgi:hypothetical protein
MTTPTAVLPTDEVTAPPPAVCPCREFWLNRVLYASPECCHTRGELPAASAVTFDSRANVAAAKAAVRAEKAVQS